MPFFRIVSEKFKENGAKLVPAYGWTAVKLRSRYLMILVVPIEQAITDSIYKLGSLAGSAIITAFRVVASAVR